MRPYRTILKPRRSILSRVLLFLASAILMMHLLVPHHHTTDHGPECEWIATQSDVVGFLINFFDLNLGENHLEDFKPKQGQFFFFMAALLVVMVSFCLVPELARGKLADRFAQIKVFLNEKLFASFRPFRAPPLTSP